MGQNDEIIQFLKNKETQEIRSADLPFKEQWATGQLLGDWLTFVSLDSHPSLSSWLPSTLHCFPSFLPSFFLCLIFSDKCLIHKEKGE